MTYHSQVLDYLSTTYGIHDASITHRGGSHPKLVFTYADKRFSATLQRDCPDNLNLVHMKQQDLRRLLGTPPDRAEISPPAQKRSLEQMTADLSQAAAPLQALNPSPADTATLMAKPPSKPLMGKMARYKDRVKFVVPLKAATALKGRGLLVERLSPDSWKLCLHPNLARKEPMIHWYKNQWQVEPSRPLALYEDLPVFGPSPAEYLIVDDEVMVRLLTDQLQPLGTGRGGHCRPAPSTPKPPMVQSAPVDELVGLPLDAMHKCLVEIRRIEQLSLYRLVKLASKDDSGERWVFRAPLIE